ncbi:histidinol phosphate phosphatase [Clostridium sp. DJ247]|uniref:histidinol phosphate phosphatase n=1 Tax=Clostridium sp. DJ247 TaxID=2726188 RepID=UPI00162A2144|nr:histidinol phosphate phosphatase [Clostridium sp. DJ247]MBC2579048.1 histidinol phosphate phosphatase [Clostridium sp. DJ247]
MFDTHLHTKVSTDSKMEIEDAIKASEAKNISLIITEHMDLNYPQKDMFCFDEKLYFDKYLKYRTDKLLLGIEIGMKADCINESRNIAVNSPFDFVIGSIHLVNNMDIYYTEFYEGKTKKEAYEEYFKCMLDCVEQYDFIDSMGHIDYIARYGKYPDPEIYYEDFSDYIDEILKSLIEKDKCIELNTRRLDDKTVVENLINIYKRYRELGGKDVTIGSDAHGVAAIGSNFDLAREIIDRCNLKAVYFKERKKEYEKI